MTDAMPRFGPLAGLRIVDLTVAQAGAFATMLLADLGAEIIKVESLQHYSTSTKGPRNPPRGEGAPPSITRDYADNDPGDDPWNRHCWFNSQARNKRDVTMDLTRPRGRELFLKLIGQADGLIENNSADQLEKLDLAPDVLHQVSPRLIVVRMPPLGSWGPDRDARGFGWHFEEFSGFLRVQGYPEGPAVGSIFMDGASGPAGANAFLMALLQRSLTGQGSVCEVSQVENMVGHIGDLTIDAAMNNRVPRRWGNRSPDFAPQGVYRCAGDDEWIAISIRNDDEWRDLGALIGDPQLLRADLVHIDGRREAHDEIDDRISSWTASREPMDAAAALQAAGVAAGPVLTEADACSDPHLHERGFFWLLEHPSAGFHFHPGTNFLMSGTPLQIWRAAPRLGEDNEYVYKELLRVSDEEYQELIDEGHVGTRYV